MKDLLYAVTTVSLVCGIVSFLSPDGKHGGLKKQVRFAAALAICAALAAPLCHLVGQEIPSFSLTFPDVTSSERGETEHAIITHAVEAICRELERDVAYRYDITDPHLTLTVNEEDLTHVILLSGELYGGGRVREAAQYLALMLQCPIIPHIEESPEVSHDSNAS